MRLKCGYRRRVQAAQLTQVHRGEHLNALGERTQKHCILERHVSVVKHADHPLPGLFAVHRERERGRCVLRHKQANDQRVVDASDLEHRCHLLETHRQCNKAGVQ